jgi:tRNA 2-selenouridine synthase
MAVTKIQVEEFVSLSKAHPVIDARSEGEFVHAHIPGAYSLPLFNNEERKIVGTAYKQQSRETAIKIGLDFFGKKMRPMVEEVEALLESRKGKNGQANNKTVLIHCWRGGMRSGAVAWLLDLYGFKVYSLAGGYKAFRNWVLQQFEKEYDLRILGGFTGSGKTYVLQQLKNKGESVVDLENLANHKGSAFGNIGLPPQPSQEMFENKLAVELVNSCRLIVDSAADKTQSINQSTSPSTVICHPSTPVWFEDESQRIGLVNIPIPLWKTMRSKTVYFLDIDFEERLNHIVQEYGKGDKEKLIGAIIRIQKRLGGLETKTAINHLIENDIKESFRILLKYYDKQYLKGLNNREVPEAFVKKVQCDKVDSKENVQRLLQSLNNE